VTGLDDVVVVEVEAGVEDCVEVLEVGTAEARLLMLPPQPMAEAATANMLNRTKERTTRLPKKNLLFGSITIQRVRARYCLANAVFTLRCLSFSPYSV
jgi:hypothetical protein